MNFWTSDLIGVSSKSCLAREKGAQYVSMESGIQRKNAHRFYEEKMNYEKWCYSSEGNFKLQ